jgi:hypothetical protein
VPLGWGRGVAVYYTLRNKYRYSGCPGTPGTQNLLIYRRVREVSAGVYIPTGVTLVPSPNGHNGPGVGYKCSQGSAERVRYHTF